MVKIQVERKVQSVAGWSKVKCAEKWMDLTSSLLSSLQCTWYLCMHIICCNNEKSTIFLFGWVRDTESVSQSFVACRRRSNDVPGGRCTYSTVLTVFLAHYPGAGAL
jgi:hypothetical protein